MGGGRVAVEERSWTFGRSLEIGVQYQEDILISLGGLRFGEKLKINIWGKQHDNRVARRGFRVPTQDFSLGSRKTTVNVDGVYCSSNLNDRPKCQ